MEKLVKLLNEKNEQDSYRVDTDSISGKEYINRGDGRQCFIDEHIISKKFWFIKRLVDNDKIDKYKVIELEHNWIRPFKLDNLYWEIKLEDRLLMLLSIQDKPLKFLISILK